MDDPRPTTTEVSDSDFVAQILAMHNGPEYEPLPPPPASGPATSGLRLVVVTEASSDSDSYGRPRTPVDEQGRVYDTHSDRFGLKELKVEIKTAEGRKVGWMDLQIIFRKHIQNYDGSFYFVLEARSNDLKELCFLFTPGSHLKPTVEHAGNRAWTAEEFAADEDMVFLETLVIDKAWRGRGVGTWALAQLLALNELREAKARYLWVWPTVYQPAWGMSEEEFEREKNRVIRFYRKEGFRRVGTSIFFCLAFDTQHVSRAIPMDEDAPSVSLPYRERKELENALQAEITKGIVWM